MSKKERSYQLIFSLICLILAIVLVIKEFSFFITSDENYIYNEYSYIQNKMLAENSFILIQIIWLIIIGISLFINYMQLQKELKNSEL